MDLALTLALWIHLLSLALGGAASFGIPALLSVSATLEPAQRPAIGKSIAKLSALGRMAIALLVLTGIFLLAVGYQGGSTLSHWFWVKMLLVLCLIGLVIYNMGNAKKMQAGDQAAIARAPMLTKIGMALLAAIVLAAVMTFN
jgi:putative membrane protein